MQLFVMPQHTAAGWVTFWATALAVATLAVDFVTVCLALEPVFLVCFMVVIVWQENWPKAGCSDGIAQLQNTEILLATLKLASEPAAVQQPLKKNLF